LHQERRTYTDYTLSGSVKNSLNDAPIFPAYIIYDQQLIASTSEGELHDQVLYQELFDVYPASIYIGDSLFAETDDYGQYWFEVQIGTYPITVVSEGWKDSLQIKEVVYHSYAVFANYILPRD
jgi:hypothetical protein